MNVTVTSLPSADSSCSISGVCRWPSILYGETFSSAEMKCVVAVAPRPAPDTPDLPSMTTSPIRPARASGASPSSAAVG